MTRDPDPLEDLPLEVRVDADLADLVPDFLSRRRDEPALLRQALRRGDLERVRAVGHNLKGCAGSYGFVGLERLGRALERAGRAMDPGAAERVVALLEQHLDAVRWAADEDPSETA